MNRIYSLVFNRILGRIQVASELACHSCGRGASPRRKRLPSTLAVAIALAGGSAWAQVASDALPTGIQSYRGISSITQNKDGMRIEQFAHRAAIDWHSFNVGADKLLRIDQASGDVLLNRVTGGDISYINGRIEAPGHVFLVNSAGVVFGQGARVDVGALVASTLDISNDDFLTGTLHFNTASNAPSASIANHGELTAQHGGSITLLGGKVANHGQIEAPRGRITLASGRTITLDPGDGGASLQAGAVGALVENHGQIHADGGQVLLTGRAVDATLQTLINNTGTVRARTVGELAGTIHLAGHSRGGAVEVAGSLDASAPDSGNGGTVRTSGTHVRIHDDARISTRADAGRTGAWTMETTHLAVRPGDVGQPGSKLLAQTLQANLENTNVALISTPSASDPGDVQVLGALAWSADTTLSLSAHQNILLDAAIVAPAGGLQLDAGAGISAHATLDLGTFALDRGNWSQRGPNLPDFSARDFRLGGGSFLRVLGGDGAQADTPYQLTDIYGLQGMVGFLTGHFALANDIDASGTRGWNCSAGTCSGFVPIGDNRTDSNPSRFTGSLDGRSHVVSGLTISAGPTYTTDDGNTFTYAGLFGRTGSGARIANIGLADANVRGHSGSYVTAGALVGFATGSVIANSYATGTVHASSDHTSYAGGLVGRSSSRVDASYAAVSVSSEVPNSVVGAAGGLVGFNHNDGHVANSYALGQVVSGQQKGGLVGQSTASSSVVRSFYATTDASGTINNRGAGGPGWEGNSVGTGRTLAQLGQRSTFASWGSDLDTRGGTGSIWRLYEGHGTPLLRSFLTPIDVTASTFPRTVYDGTVATGIAAYDTSISGALLDGSLAYMTRSGNVGVYRTTDGSLVLSGLYSGQQGYDISYGDASMTIDPRAITVTADSLAKVYGNADPSLTWSVTEGSLVGADTLTGALTREAGENVGRYTIDASALANGNYVVTAIDGVLTIDPRAITVTADSLAKVYGNADPTLTWSVTEGSLVGADTLTGALTREAGENVGRYTIDASALANGNYVVTAIDGVLTIDPRAITIAAHDARKVYGDTDPMLSWSFKEGSLAASDTMTVTLVRSSGENAGTYTIGTSVQINDNYVVTAIDGVLTIDPRAITVTADSLAKVYGNADPTLTWSVTEGSLVGADTLTGALTREAGENVGRYTIDASALANGNYVITAIDGVLTIDPRAITITADSLAKVYGNADPTLTWSVTEGSLVGADTLTGALTREAGENVGRYTIDASALANGNYVVTAIDGVLTIDPRAITVTADSLAKVYGNADPTLTWSVTEGSLVGADTLTGALIREAGENVGHYTIDASALANGNYVVTAIDGVLTIDKASLTITALDAFKPIGRALTPTAHTVEGLRRADTVHSVRLHSAGTPVTAAPGRYAIDVSDAAGTGLDNYVITYVGGDLQVGLADRALADAAAREQRGLRTEQTWRQQAATTVPAADGLFNVDGAGVHVPSTARCAPEWPAIGCGDRAPD
ncbi:MBG domain-containing protein [Luteimonas sp. TWI406]|uniref:MBG domain-containing protein n=2 Tax=unclassified Luteimonas TaxID=2629088 RepID=UPI00320A2491